MSEPTPPASPEADKRAKERVERRLSLPAASASGAVSVDGRSLAWRSRVEFMPIAASSGANAGDPEAAIGCTSYLLDGADPRVRPVCFAFNGGPGSSSIWLHLGALGPKRVVVPDDAGQAPPPWAVVDNPHTWLPAFDLVFVDPPHTGWSLTAGDEVRKRMCSVDGDVAALAELIRVWLVRHGRWGAPVYLAGESYGTTRAAALADALAEKGCPLAGLILVSCAIDLQTLIFARGNDLPNALYLPAYAVVSQRHGLVRGTPEKARQDAEDYVGSYLAALHAGARLDARSRARVAGRLAALTGLPRALVEDGDLRIDLQTYLFEALRPQGRMIGRLDARATAPMGATKSREWEFDPGLEAIYGAYVAAGLSWFSQLGVGLEDRYEVMNLEVNEGWGWQRGKSSSPLALCSTSAELSRALRRSEHLRVLFASGMYDLATPFSATDWSIAHLDVPASVHARITHRTYDAGHMMYTRTADLVSLQRDVLGWVAGS